MDREYTREDILGAREAAESCARSLAESRFEAAGINTLICRGVDNQRALADFCKVEDDLFEAL